MMRCLVTGATGHIGSFLTRKLLDENAVVGVLVDKNRNIHRIEPLVPRIALLSDEESVRAFAPEVVFHLAWSGVSKALRDNPAQVYDNVPYALNVFRMAAEAGARTWIGVGSQAELGPTDSRPAEAYGVAKLAVALLTEKLCRLAGMRFVWIRLLATYGPADDERRLIPMLIRKLQARETPALTAGDQYIDYLYVEDVADALWAAATNESVDGIFNLGSGDPIRVRDLAELVRDLIDPNATLAFGHVPGGARDLRADTSRFRAATQWRPRTRLREGLEKTVQWYSRKNQ